MTDAQSDTDDRYASVSHSWQPNDTEMNGDYQAVCERAEGQFERVVVPLELHEDLDLTDISVSCPQCDKEMEVEERDE